MSKEENLRAAAETSLKRSLGQRYRPETLITLHARPRRVPIHWPFVVTVAVVWFLLFALMVAVILKTMSHFSRGCLCLC
uniref:Uncharacterized protein n=1 Tax=Steinernema glaseri TaxID=37863 RepID=A0A1I7Y9Z4_9BILA